MSSRLETASGPNGGEKPGFSILRQQERTEVGENLASGPGYARIAADYLGVENPAARGRFTPKIAQIHDLDEKLLVPVMRNSLYAGQYLEGIIEPAEVLNLGEEIQVVVCKTPEDASRLRWFAPIAFPSSTIERALMRLDPEFIPEKEQAKTAERIAWCLDLDEVVRFLESPSCEEQRYEKELERKSYAKALDLEPEELSLFLGAEEALKAILRILSKEGRQPFRVKLPLPNYMNFISNAQHLGAEVFEDKLDAPNCDAFYLSLPNNPLGYNCTPEQLLQILKTVNEEVIILDLTNFDGSPDRDLYQFSQINAFKKALSHIKKRIIFVDSSSKDLISSEARVGFAATNDARMHEALRAMEPPALGRNSEAEVLHRIGSFFTPADLKKQTKVFLTRLSSLCAVHQGQITLMSGSVSSFCGLLFHDEALLEQFLSNLATHDVKPYGIARITRLPLQGAGAVPPNAPLPKAGPEIMGLPKNALRLCTASHPFVLEVLEETLKDVKTSTALI